MVIRLKSAKKTTYFYKDNFIFCWLDYNDYMIRYMCKCFTVLIQNWYSKNKGLMEMLDLELCSIRKWSLSMNAKSQKHFLFSNNMMFLSCAPKVFESVSPPDVSCLCRLCCTCTQNEDGLATCSKCFCALCPIHAGIGTSICESDINKNRKWISDPSVRFWVILIVFLFTKANIESSKVVVLVVYQVFKSCTFSSLAGIWWK